MKRPVALQNVPASHGTGVVAPATHQKPTGHAKHAILPLSFEKVPAAQSGQMLRPMAALAVPRGHARHATELLAPVVGW